MEEDELLNYLKNELGFIIGEQILGCFYHANSKFEVGVKSDLVKKRICEKISRTATPNCSHPPSYAQQIYLRKFVVYCWDRWNA